jgi:hypothetical protein
MFTQDAFILEIFSQLDNTPFNFCIYTIMSLTFGCPVIRPVNSIKPMIANTITRVLVCSQILVFLFDFDSQ